MAWLLFALAATSASVYAQSNPCGNASQRGAKIGGAGNGVLNNVPDYVEAPPGTFTLNAYDLNSSSSRPNLVPGVSYTWSQTAGTAGAFSTTSAGATRFTLPNVIKPPGAPSNWPGEVIRVKLTIVSTLAGCPGTWEDTATFNVIDIHNPVVNLPPNAQATALPGTAAEGDAVSLSAEGSYDPEGLALAYSWTQVSGTTVTLSGANTASASFIAPNTAFPAGQTLVFSLRVSDGVFEDVQEVAVNVTWINDPPMAVLNCPPVVDERESFTLDGSASTDGDDGIALYEWAGGWNGLDLTSASGNTVQLIAPTLGYQDPGTYDFRLTTFDAQSHAFDECQVLVRDVTAPQLALPEDIDEEADGPAGNVVSYLASAFDAVDGSLLHADYFGCAPASGGVFPLGVAPDKSATTQVDCWAKDSAGNRSAGSFNVTVRDTTAPTFEVPAAFTVEATSADGAVVEFSVPTSDVVDGAGWADCTPASGETLALGTHAVSCSATDQRGNASAAQGFDVTVADRTAPAIQVPASFTLEATGPGGAAAVFAASWTDAVDGAGDASCSHASGATFPITTTQVTCSHTDRSGNLGTGSFSITVQDTTPPTIEVPEPIVREATGPGGARVTYAALMHDLVDGTAPATCAPAPGSVFPLGGTLVQCGGQDSRGNVAMPASFQVTVVDTTPPALNVPGPLRAEATGPSGAAVAFTATAVDLVDGDVEPVCTPASGSTFALGESTVSCHAMDSRGNASASQAFTVTVVDTTPPQLAGLVDVSAVAAGSSQALVNYTSPTATDRVDGPVAVNCSPASGTYFAMGTTMVSCAATDRAGNTGRGEFSVHVSYTFNGFFQPIDNGMLNSVKAGSAIPVKFSLGGNQGLQVFAGGSPAPASISCAANATADEVELTVTAGASSLQYDPGTDQYTYVWKTEKSWLGCRQLRVTLKDGSVRTAMFKFR